MIYLCSTSPRRLELMTLITKKFQIKEPNFQEVTSSVNPVEYTLKNATGKAKSVKDKVLGENNVFIGADTVVSVNNEILGKPKSTEDAKKQLKILSCNHHTVITGVSLLYNDLIIENFSKTEVYFNELSDFEIENYIKTEEPFDKAGSYGIQGLGSRFVNRIEGCYFNVVGLPVSLIYNMLKENNLLLYHN